VAVYHCQQAAEKAVKAFLVHHGKTYERTHDIEVLVSGCDQTFTLGKQTFSLCDQTFTPLGVPCFCP